MSFVIGISRYLLPFLTLLILTKCVLALLLGHPKEKIYGYIIDMADGERYPLNMWETSIGRSNSCDIVVGYDTVSRFHAVISRRIDGWYVYDLISKSGIEINGKKADKKATIRNGDVLTLGAMQYKFEVVNDPVQRVGKKRGKQSAPLKKPPVSEYPRPQTPYEPGYGQGGSPYGQNGQYGVPPQNTSGYTQPQNPAGYTPTQNPNGYAASSTDTEFYDSSYRPDLHFKKSPQSFSDVDYGFYTDVGTDKDKDSGEYTIDTPAAKGSDEGFQSYAQQPAIVNRDTGEVFILCGNLVSIGRNRSCDIKLTSPSASRRHANLVLYEDGWAIMDAGSSAGTFLNGNRVTEPQLLFDGDIIALSDERLSYTVRPGN